MLAFLQGSRQSCGQSPLGLLTKDVSVHPGEISEDAKAHFEKRKRKRNVKDAVWRENDFIEKYSFRISTHVIK